MRRDLVMFIVAVLVVAVPAVLLVWMREGTEDRLAGLEPDPVPMVMPVERREIWDQTAVTVAGVWREPDVVSAGSWIGTVTRVDVSPGDTVASGDVVMRIDAVDRVAVVSSDPFWRPLRRGDTGGDVVMLQQWLTDAGFFDGEVDGVFGSDLRASVIAWAVSLGVVKPDGTFDPAWVLWLPQEPFVVASVEIARGVPAPGPGSEILTGPVPFVSVSLTDQNGRSLTPDGAWILTVGGIDVYVVDGMVDVDGLATLASVLDPEQPAASGRIQRAEPVETLEIPATAVVSNAAGTLCVFVPDGDGLSPTPVELSGGSASSVNVASGLSQGDVVLVNPTDVFEAPVCP